MRKLSFWAKHHPLYARVIIIIAHCLLIWMGYFAGSLLSESGTGLSPLWIYILIGICFITGAFYPSGKSSKNYSKRKLFEFVIAGCGFLLTVCLVNDLNKPFTFYQTAQAVVPTDPSPYKYSEAKTLLEQFQKGEKTKFTSKERRVIKKEFKYQLFQYTKAKITGNKEDEGHTVGIILICIAAVGLFILLSSLACSLSCNGSEAAAWIVFILGTAAIVWGTIALIRSISHKHETIKSKPSQ
jgi:hypothetical protein